MDLRGGCRPGAGGKEDLRHLAGGLSQHLPCGAGQQALCHERLPLCQPGAHRAVFKPADPQPDSGRGAGEVGGDVCQ